MSDKVEAIRKVIAEAYYNQLEELCKLSTEESASGGFYFVPIPSSPMMSTPGPNGFVPYIFDQDDPELAAEQHRLATEGGIVWNPEGDCLWPEPETEAAIIPKCECGSEKVGSPRHSSYCPKHVEHK
jgi:hypothetical protein